VFFGSLVVGGTLTAALGGGNAGASLISGFLGRLFMLLLLGALGAIGGAISGAVSALIYTPAAAPFGGLLVALDTG